MINLLLPLLMIFFLKKKHSAVVLLEEFSRYKINNMASFVKTIKLADKKKIKAMHRFRKINLILKARV